MRVTIRPGMGLPGGVCIEPDFVAVADITTADSLTAARADVPGPGHRLIDRRPGVGSRARGCAVDILVVRRERTIIPNLSPCARRRQNNCRRHYKN